MFGLYDPEPIRPECEPADPVGELRRWVGCDPMSEVRRMGRIPGETRSGFPTDYRKPESDAGWIDPVYEPGVGRVGGTRKGTRLTERPNGGWVEGSTRRNFRRMDWDTGKWVPMWTDPGWEGWWAETNDRMFPELY